MKKREDKWRAWIDSENVSDDAFIDRDQPLERLRGSVREYAMPFEPAEDWETPELEPSSPTLECDLPVYSTPSGPRYVRVREVPAGLQDDFQRYLRGAGVPVVDGEDGPVAFVTDWLDWWHGRRPDRRPNVANDSMSAAVMRTIPNIAREWGVPNRDMATLMGVDAQTFQHWSSNPGQAELSDEQRLRASYLLGIYKALEILLPFSDRQRHWLHQANRDPLFQEFTPIAYLLCSGLEGLQSLRQYLDAERRGEFA